MTDVMSYLLSHKLDVQLATCLLPEGHPSNIASTITPVTSPPTTQLLAKSRLR